MSAAAVVEVFGRESFSTFLDEDGNHDERCRRICPPPAQCGVQDEPAEHYGGEVGAGSSLCAFSFHGLAAHLDAEEALAAGEDRDDDQRDCGQRDADRR
jgi:hypothetical protein